MCRLLIAEGAAPDKVWISGNLSVPSHNKPDCLVRWSWHVAPTLQVSINGTTQTYVIDPSLCNEPVPQAAWKALQGDPLATLTPSSARIYYYWSGQTDDLYTDTNAVLEQHRMLLKLRSVSSVGPPPYTTCMVRPDRGPPNAALVHLGLAGTPALGVERHAAHPLPRWHATNLERGGGARLRLASHVVDHAPKPFSRSG
jgi:hypothetical protein